MLVKVLFNLLENKWSVGWYSFRVIFKSDWWIYKIFVGDRGRYGFVVLLEGFIVLYVNFDEINSGYFLFYIKLYC